MRKYFLKFRYINRNGNETKVWYKCVAHLKHNYLSDIRFLSFIYEDGKIVGGHFFKKDIGTYDYDSNEENFDLYLNGKEYSYLDVSSESDEPSECRDKIDGEYHLSFVSKEVVDGILLNDDNVIPSIGYGTWLIKNEDAEECVYNALMSGYRHIDTAQAYGNEEGVMYGVIKSGIPREEIFITSKVDASIKNFQKAKESIEESRSKLKRSYIDLMLIHCPTPWEEYNKGGYRYEKENVEVYQAMQNAVTDGHIISLGVSNFNKHDLDNILNNCSIKPVVNQIPVFIGYTDLDLIEYCHSKGVLVESYSPLGHGRTLSDPFVIKMAEKYHVSTAQLCIKYVLQLGTVALPKASSLEHMKQNLMLDFEISDEDMEVLKNYKE